MLDLSTPVGLGVLFLVTTWGIVLSYMDCRWRRLPNAWTLGGAAAALAIRLATGGGPAFLDGFAAAAAAGVFLLIPFLLRGAGGGDVKMLFAAGAICGWGRVLPLLWVTSLAGLLMGGVMLTAGRLDGARLKHVAKVLFDWRYDRHAGRSALPPRDSDRVRMPFSLPITVGLLWAILVPPG
jgi:Flp pilus assembly protein protease CpaA